MQLNKFAGYTKVDETANFAVLYNPTKNPLDAWKDESVANYLLVYKLLDTIEAESDSIVVAMEYLKMAQSGFEKLHQHDGNVAEVKALAH